MLSTHKQPRQPTLVSQKRQKKATSPLNAQYALVFHGFLKQTSELFPLFTDFIAEAWSEHQHSFLRNCAFDELIDIVCRETQCFQPSRLVSKLNEKFCQSFAEHLPCTLLSGLRDVLAKNFCGRQVS